jgi:hypothetical protein
METKILPVSVSPNKQKPQHKGFRRPILEILEDLKKPVEKRFIKFKINPALKDGVLRGKGLTIFLGTP